jgi:hypothetical protein
MTWAMLLLHCREWLPRAFDQYRRSFFLTMPPFRESWHEGQLTDDDYLPHFPTRSLAKHELWRHARIASYRAMRAYPQPMSGKYSG